MLIFSKDIKIHPITRMISFTRFLIIKLKERNQLNPKATEIRKVKERAIKIVVLVVKLKN
jgi:hypothetical protein